MKYLKIAINFVIAVGRACKKVLEYLHIIKKAVEAIEEKIEENKDGK